MTAPTPPRHYIPPGWGTGITNDGKIFYINHITQTTQWNPPEYIVASSLNDYEQSINNATAIPSKKHTDFLISDKPTDSPSKMKKTWNKYKIYFKIIWILCTLILAISNLYSNIRVAEGIYQMVNAQICTSLECGILDLPGFVMQILNGMAITLFFTASIGFVVGMIFKYKKSKTLYNVHKYSQSSSDENRIKEMKLKDEKRDLLWGWIPLFIEDFISLSIMAIFTAFTVDIKGLGFIFMSSNIISLISLIKSIGISCYSHYSIRNKIKCGCIRCCHICWVILLSIMVLLLSFALWITWISSQTHKAEPWLNIGIDPYYNETTCSTVDIGSWNAEDNSGTFYSGSQIDTLDYNKRVDIACVSMDNYHPNDTMSCVFGQDQYYIGPDSCPFEIPIQTCGNITFGCPNDYGGHRIWVCYDYCLYHDSYM